MFLGSCVIMRVVFAQGSRSRCSYLGRDEGSSDGSADPSSDAPNRSSDRLGHGVPRFPSFCPQRSGHQELFGWRRAGGEDRGLWDVERHLQHWLLQGKTFRKQYQWCYSKNGEKSQIIGLWWVISTERSYWDLYLWYMQIWLQFEKSQTFEKHLRH